MFNLLLTSTGNMLFWNAALAILVIICSNYQVQSNLNVLMKKYDFRNQRLIIGTNHIDETRLIYALCSSDEHNTKFNCQVELDSKPFDHKVVKPYSCKVDYENVFYHGKVDLLGVDIFSQHTAIIRWQNINLDNIKSAIIRVQEVNMKTCFKEKHEFMADNRDDLRPQIFIIPSVNSYIIAFKDHNKCDESFCKMTVYNDGTVRRAVKWFHTNSFLNAVDVYNHYPNTFMVSTKENEMYKYYVLSENELKEVATLSEGDTFAWSTSNGRISLCQQVECVYLNLVGRVIDRLKIDVKPTKYAALYNLPNFSGHLAVICNSQTQNNYRIIKIGNNGREEFSVNLEELPCAYDFPYMTSKFYMKNSTEYCLSLFHSQYSHTDRFIFSNYCFSA